MSDKDLVKRENLKSDEEEVDWSKYDLEISAKEKAHNGTLDEELPTPVKIKDIDAPELVAEVPTKPGMLASLKDFQAGRIKKTQYIAQLKLYAETQTEIYSDAVEKTVMAHKTLTDAALEGIREKVNLWAKEIMLVTDICIQDAVNRAILMSQDNANKTLTQLAKSKSHPVIVKESMKRVTDFMRTTMDKIMARSMSFGEKGKINWER